LEFRLSLGCPLPAATRKPSKRVVNVLADVLRVPAWGSSGAGAGMRSNKSTNLRIFLHPLQEDVHTMAIREPPNRMVDHFWIGE